MVLVLCSVVVSRVVVRWKSDVTVVRILKSLITAQKLNDTMLIGSWVYLDCTIINMMCRIYFAIYFIIPNRHHFPFHFKSRILFVNSDLASRLRFWVLH